VPSAFFLLLLLAVLAALIKIAMTDSSRHDSYEIGFVHG
jgi:hypothetical protein